jgi:curved DNA-binding protein CbpA
VAKGDFYERLGVRPDATSEAIKRAYLRLAKKLHPDVDRSPRAHERFLAVKEAYEVLSNPLLRREFDERPRRPANLWDVPPPRSASPARVIRVSPPFANRPPRAVRLRTSDEQRRYRQLSFAYTAAAAGTSVAFLAGSFLLVALGGVLQGVLSFLMGLTLVLVMLHVFPVMRLR